MRQIDHMSSNEIEVLGLKGMLKDHSYPLPEGWPTQEQQAAYWQRKELEQWPYMSAEQISNDAAEAEEQEQ
jgi:hypothetical protein